MPTVPALCFKQPTLVMGCKRGGEIDVCLLQSLNVRKP